MSSKNISPAPRRSIGRPRRLNLAQIVHAGVELGLENLNIGALASRLGVSAGVIYTYVRNIEELRRLVVVALAERPALEDKGQHWADIVRAYVGNLHAILSSEPHLMSQLALGAGGPEEGLPDAEHFLGLMMSRGLSLEEAWALYAGGGQIAAGSALVVAMELARERRGESRRALAEAILAQKGADAYPRVAALGEAYLGGARERDYRPTLELFLSAFAARRGEELPPATAVPESAQS